ncbi:IclR family transcriptional regulator C-terminal domain-containing protein [Microbacter sp. GSS18]|nr:IclR family transcriptional regulator C-terminal domain-containing protein [Microbacter sp. GSS18]
MARGSQGQSVLHRHLRVMDAFDALNPFLTLAQITQRSGLAHSTAQRIVRELEGERLLERMPDRTYRLGLRLWEFASRTPGGAGLRELARPWVAAVHARVRQHAQLGVRSGHEILFIERMSTPDAVVNSTIIGGRMPLPVSSLGLVLLAYAGDDVIDAVVDEGWPAPTRFALRDEDSLRARLRRVRADGFAVTDGFIYEESRGIAVPVLASQNTPTPHWGSWSPMTPPTPDRSSSCSRWLQRGSRTRCGTRTSPRGVHGPPVGCRASRC